MKSYGRFESRLAGYTITELPPVGNYEYIYKNEDMLVKLDQYGVSFAQLAPPVGVALFKREKRETGSPVKIYFENEKGVFNNFDVFSADSLEISFLPECATYTLTFGDMIVKTEVTLPKEGERLVLKTEFINKGEDTSLKVMPLCYPYLNELLMAPWDKPEWYTSTRALSSDAFVTTRYSIAGKKEERRFLTLVSDKKFSSKELSSERLLSDTKNFTVIPNEIGKKTGDIIYSFEQCMAGVVSAELKKDESYALTLCFALSKEEEIEKTVEKSRTYFCQSKMQEVKAELTDKFQKLFSVKQIKTGDETFDRFVNGFLPIELDWVSSLDRGWPTGMRGVRDASNDFQGFLSYDKELCREVIENIFSKQRSDGWYPRQIPFGGGDKFDMRGFVDSACFFTEFVYEYISYTNDYSVLEKQYPYFDDEKLQTGLEHLLMGMHYLIKEENIGEHGLVKMRGGDWLDCLSNAGLKGRAETVMVSCQLIMCLKYVDEILNKVGKTTQLPLLETAEKLGDSINKYAFNGKGFYNAIFTDNGNWLFSDKDEDSEERIYVPTNSYAIISGVAKGKEKGIIDTISGLRTDKGYKLFTTPLGGKYIEGIGKMGTGDFQAYFSENAGVYNHGSQCFLLRALWEMGEHDTFYDVLGLAMPLYEDIHKPEDVCGAPYAITNCYQLVPSFEGRQGFSFLTGSVAMIERAVYSWMLGFNFTTDSVVIKPCLPKRFANTSAYIPYGDGKITVKYTGFGANIKSACVNGKEVKSDGRSIVIDKNEIEKDLDIEIVLS